MTPFFRSSRRCVLYCQFLQHRSAFTVVRQNLDSEAPFSFNVAFHTYFRVLFNAQINGLDRYAYANNLDRRKVTDPSEIRVIDKEVDRIYFNVANPVVLVILRGSSLVIAGNALPDVVLWNPWIEKQRKCRRISQKMATMTLSAWNTVKFKTRSLLVW